MADRQMRGRIRQVGVITAMLLAAAQIAYAGILAAGLATLPSPEAAITEPWFTLMEGLILVIAPLMVVLMAVLHLLTRGSRRLFSLLALVFTALLAGLTSAVHFTILVLSRDPAMGDAARWLAFEWPSLVYVLDILAWDIFFALAVLFAAGLFSGGGLAAWIRGLLITSGLLALAGLAGVALADMQIRNIGILGYAAMFPAATVLIAIYLHKKPLSAPRH